MTEKSSLAEQDVPEKVAIESKLPLNAIDIESQKDMESGRYHALRSLHKWFAARPTPAVRLAVLASVYPGEIDSDELLRLMKIGPKVLDTGIADYVEKKFTEKRGSGTLDDHYGYPNPNTQSPTDRQLGQLHEKLKDAWGGELPTILDPTAGRGIIPFEAVRYGLPAHANELNPVPTLILKTALEYAPIVGSLEEDLKKWRDEIHKTAKKEISSYYPTEKPEREILNSACTYLISCDSCGGEIPLVSRWTVNKTSDGGDAIKPVYTDGSVDYEHVKIQNIEESEFDPSNGPVSGRDAECPHCKVITQEGDIQEKIRSGEFEYSIYGVNYETPRRKWRFRAGSEVDAKGMEKARERAETDFELLTFLTEPIDVSSRTNDPTSWGMAEWRDIFTPRQLVSHYEYLQAYNEVADKIRDSYSTEKSDAILTILTFPVCKAVDLNSRLSVWRDTRGFGANIFGENNFSQKKMFVDNNISAARRGYMNNTDHAILSYEKIESYIQDNSPATVSSTDAARLTDEIPERSVDVAVVDPPYYSSIMYGELSDLFYVVHKEYLGEAFPDLFASKLTNKDDEAVANPYRFDSIAEEHDDSKKKLADEFYENKMEDIFSEIFELLSEGGVMTVMFTHRDMNAWDTLTTALIGAGFTITATHPIKTEMSDRVGLRDKASADSSIILVGRKIAKENSDAKTLWEDIQSNISDVAKNQAREILDSGYTISKTDTAIAAYGPTLKTYAENYPVVDKKGEEIRPRKALSEARKAVTGVIAERFLRTKGLEKVDALTRWYILAWLIYDNHTFPYDEGLQLGVAAGVDVEEIKRSTKIWNKSRGDIRLAEQKDRVQDIVLVESDEAENPSKRKFPVNPTDRRFTYTIDTLHAALHVYEKEGARAAKDWLLERNLKSDDEFEISVTALIEVLPNDNQMYQTLINLVSGETSDYLDIDLNHIKMMEARQRGLDEY